MGMGRMREAEGERQIVFLIKSFHVSETTLESFLG